MSSLCLWWWWWWWNVCLDLYLSFCFRLCNCNHVSLCFFQRCWNVCLYQCVCASPCSLKLYLCVFVFSCTLYPCLYVLPCVLVQAYTLHVDHIIVQNAPHACTHSRVLYVLVRSQRIYQPSTRLRWSLWRPRCHFRIPACKGKGHVTQSSVTPQVKDLRRK